MICYRTAIPADAAQLAALRSQFLVESKEIAIAGQSLLRETSLAFFKDHLHSDRRLYHEHAHTAQRRARGIASNVFSLFCEEAKEKGCGQIMLNATDMRRPIHEKYGFFNSEDDMILYIRQEKL